MRQWIGDPLARSALEFLGALVREDRGVRPSRGGANVPVPVDDFDKENNKVPDVWEQHWAVDVLQDQGVISDAHAAKVRAVLAGVPWLKQRPGASGVGKKGF